MTRQTLRRSTGQAGFTLAEILVATAVFLIIFIGAMMLYDRSNTVFKQGVEASDMQQNTRVAFDKVVADLRMAGYDFDRDGRPAGGLTTAWKATTLYGKGATVSPTIPNGFRYKCSFSSTTIYSGTSGATEPVWPTTTGDTIDDGATPITWTALAGTAEYQQPDEQIEFVGSSAITVRANFNFEDPTTPDNGREYDYEPTLGEFPIVTTSNKDIATYALRSDRGKNEDDITFYADIKKPRNSFPGADKEQLVTIGKFDDCMTGTVWDGCKQPPYTLYRVTLADDYSSSGNVVETPIASNIRSLRFKYYEDIAGTEALRDLAATPVVIPNYGAIGGAGQYDPADATLIIADRLIRTKIKSIGVELVGMSEAPDLNYTNPDETASAYTDTAGRTVEVPRYRQYRVESLVSPRNIGKHGMREQDVHPPGSPKMTRAWIGACGILTVEWDAPDSGPGTGAVEQYAVLWDNDNAKEPFKNEKQVGLSTSAAIQVGGEPDATWFFRIKALNGYGSALSDELGAISTQALNRTKPEAPTSFTAASTAANSIKLDWIRPLAVVSGDYRSTKGETMAATTIPVEEIVAYQVYRSETSPVDTLAPQNLVFNGKLDSDPISGATTWTDSNIVNCVPYYYTVRAVETCEEKDSYNESPAVDRTHGASEFTAEVKAEATSTAKPANPADLTLASTPISGFDYDIKLRWPHVTTDAIGDALNVSYEIEKLQFNDDGSPGSDTFPIISVPYSIDNIVEYHDTASLHDASGMDKVYYLYRVRATNCSEVSDWTIQRRWPCDFDATIVLGYSPEPAAFDGDGLSAAGAWLIPGITGIRAGWSAPVAEIHADLYRAGDGALVGDLGTFKDPVGSDVVFPIDGAEDGVIYRVDIQVKDAAGCMAFESRFIQESPAGCCLAPDGFAAVVTGTSLTKTITFINMCDVPLVFDPSGIVITFTSTSTSPRTKLSNVNYPVDGGGTVDDPTVKGGGLSEGTRTLLSSDAIAAGASRTVVAGGTYAVVLSFTSANYTLDCATGVYRRPTDLSPQTCRVFPGTGGTTCP